MPRIRIFTAAAALVLTALTSQAALAQTTSSNPRSLLAGLAPPHATKAVAHHKFHRRLTARRSKTHLAAGSHEELAAQAPEPQTPSSLVTPPPAADSAPIADSAPPVAAAQNDATRSQDPNQLVVSGQTVQIAAPDQVNPIDLAADSRDDAAAASPPVDAAAPAPAVAADSAQAAPPAMSAQNADTIAPAQAVLAAPNHRDAGGGTLGSASWIAQVLAALGGAVTAGVVAWFLIGSGPVRTYG